MKTFYFPFDFRFTFEGPKAKATENLQAIQLLKQMERENRSPETEEQIALAKFVGFGQTEVKRQADLLNLLDEITEEESESLNASMLNAHYTDLDIIRAIWDAMLHLGFGGLGEFKVLDPSAGIGHFRSAMPEGLRDATRWAEIEIDNLTARMLQMLHPDEMGRSKVYQTAFEKTNLMDNWFDLAISNVPFGDYAVIDHNVKNSKLKAQIHDYFFVRALAALKPGGILAFITSRYSLDKKDPDVRAWLARRAELLTAIRLPQSAFRRNAGTEVVTDLVVMRKRGKDLQGGELPAWVRTEPIALKSSYWNDGRLIKAPINAWFVEHPELIIGDVKLARGMYSPDELTVQYDEDDIAEQLRARLLDQLPKDVLIEHPIDVEEKRVDQNQKIEIVDVDCKSAKLNHFAIPIPSKVNETVQAQLILLQEIHRTAKELLNEEIEGRSPEMVSALRASLNEKYDQYLWRYGPINLPQTAKLLKDSPALPFLRALEKNYDPHQRSAEKADLFYTPTLRGGYGSVKIETAQDALLVCLGEMGAVDIPTIAGLAGMEEDQVIEELDGLIFLDPKSNIWQTSESYLSGNVREKLNIARLALDLDPLFLRNVKALEESLPIALKPSQIKVHLGAMWLPAEIIREFIEFLLPGAHEADVEVTQLPVIGSWHLDVRRRWALPEFEMMTKYGITRLTALELIDDCLNSRSPVVYDEVDDKRIINKTETVAAQAKLAEIQAAFEEWIWADAERAARVADLYNQKVNVYRRPAYNGSHLKLPGLSWGVPVAPYQLNAIWRAAQSKTTLFAHEVGLGKTRMAVISIMEMIRLGFAKKAMIVVPNHVVSQWQAEVLNSYPAADVLCATPKDLSKSKRQEFMSRIATGQWDIVIVPQSSFKALPVGSQVLERFTRGELRKMREFLEELKAKSAPYSARKAIEKSIKNFEAKLDQLADMKKDSEETITFEQLGVDLLVVDEFHAFKNLFFATKMSNVTGLPHNKTERAWDMFIKIRHLLENGGRFIGLTATPVTNSITEAFVMQEYFQYDDLQSMGLGHFDNWAKLFAEEVTSLEMTADGASFQLVTRLSRYTNLPELSAMFGQFCEVLRWKDVPQHVVHRPELYQGKPVVIVTPGSDELKAFISNLAERVQKIKSNLVEPRDDNMLVVTTDGRKAALDMSLVDPRLPESPYSKIAVAADLIARIYHVTTKWKAAQLVFSDLGTPSKDLKQSNGKRESRSETDVGPVAVEEIEDSSEVHESDEAEDRVSEQNKVPVAVDIEKLKSLYVRFKRKLIERGVLENEIAFIHDAKTQAERAALFEAVRDGCIRVLLGSTEKMGTGMNVQNRVIALHHLDAPWRPADITQRDGRMLRQGNRYSETFIFTYITDSSPDGFVWQKLETKNAAIEQFMYGLLTQREMEDISDVTLSMAEIKAAASGNPKIIEHVALQSEIVRLVHVHAAWLDNQQTMRLRSRDMGVEIDGLTKRITALEVARKIAYESSQGDFQMTVGEKMYTERKLAGEAIHEAAVMVVALAAKERGRVERTIGSYRGFRLIVRAFPLAQAWTAGIVKSPGDELLLDFGDPIRLVAHVGHTGLGTVQSIDAILRGLEDLIKKDDEHRDALETQLAALNEGLTRPWEHAEYYIRLQRRLFLIDRSLTRGGVNIQETNIPTIHDITMDTSPETETEEALGEVSAKAGDRRGENIIEVEPLLAGASGKWIEGSPELVAALKRLTELHTVIPVDEALTIEQQQTPSQISLDELSARMSQGEQLESPQMNIIGLDASAEYVMPRSCQVSTQSVSLLQDEGGPLPIEAWLTAHTHSAPASRKRKSKVPVPGQLSLL